MQVGDPCLHERFFMSELPIIDVYTARQRASGRDDDDAIPLISAAVDELFDAGQLGWCGPATGVLVEALLHRGADAVATEIDATVDRLAGVSADHGWVINAIRSLRVRTLLAQARGDDVSDQDFRERYRDMATSLGFEGHMAWAEAMP